MFLVGSESSLLCGFHPPSDIGRNAISSNYTYVLESIMYMYIYSRIVVVGCVLSWKRSLYCVMVVCVLGVHGHSSGEFRVRVVRRLEMFDCIYPFDGKFLISYKRPILVNSSFAMINICPNQATCNTLRAVKETQRNMSHRCRTSVVRGSNSFKASFVSRKKV